MAKKLTAYQAGLLTALLPEPLRRVFPNAELTLAGERLYDSEQIEDFQRENGKWLRTYNLDDE